MHKFVSEDSEESVIDVLTELEKHEITKSSLEVFYSIQRFIVLMIMCKKTRIGIAVGKLRKHKTESVAKKADALVRKWKKAVTQKNGNDQQGESRTAASSTTRKLKSAEGATVSSTTKNAVTNSKPNSFPFAPPLFILTLCQKGLSNDSRLLLVQETIDKRS